MKTPNNDKADIAIALQYNGKNAPRVTAKGEDEIARHIKKIAEENDIPLHEDLLLAQVLSQIDLGEEIPRSLYLTIARVIAFSYLMAGRVSPVPLRTHNEDISSKDITTVRNNK
ncbi:MAG: flagellar protein FhlB [Gammaproteobacteria bacterium]|nr:flagellar protein FhlB [Gammaproteobacteria bacterium]